MNVRSGKEGNYVLLI